VTGAGDAPRAGAPVKAEAPGDRLLIHGLLVVLAVAASFSPIRNFDYWWHLATGRLILEQGSVPRADPFSFTAAGTPWVDGSWLFQVLAYLAHAAWGPTVLVCFKVALVTGVGLLATRVVRRAGHGPAGAAILLAPAFIGAAFRFDVRPELATLILAPAILALAQQARDARRPRLLLWVPAIVALWANLHPGVVLAPVFLAVASAATWIWDCRLAQPARSPVPRPSFARPLALAAVAALVAVGANPYGFRIYPLPWTIDRILAELPSPNLEWAPPAVADFPLFWIALPAVALIVLIGWRHIDPIATPALILSGAIAALHLRNIGLFFVLLPFALARPARALVNAAQATVAWRVASAGGQVRPGFIAAAVLIVVSVPALVWLPPGATWGWGMAAGNEPRAAVDFLEREEAGTRLFNDVKFGGYLIWRRFPGHRVFMDGRNEVYPDLLREVFGGLRDAAAWKTMLDRHGLDAALLRYPPSLQKVRYPGRPGRPPIEAERAFSAAYFPREEWALVYWDDDAMVFLRRTAARAAMIAAHEYRAIHPDDWLYLYGGVLIGRVDVRPILEELQRKIHEDPDCERARSLEARFRPLGEAAEIRPTDPGTGG
jgi:hypothetical protein